MRTLKSKGLFASLALSVLFMVGSVATAHANEPDKEKEKKNQPKTEKAVETRWFHFMGDASNPSELADQNNYTPVTSSPCESETQPYRCAILIDSDPSNSNLPDLSQPVQAETKRNSPAPTTP